MIDKFKNLIKRIFGAYDGIELAFVIIFASAIFLGFPYYIIKELIQDGHYFLAIAIALFLIFTLVICIRDFRLKKFSILSITTAILWGICFFIVILEMGN